MYIYILVYVYTHTHTHTHTHKHTRARTHTCAAASIMPTGAAESVAPKKTFGGAKYFESKCACVSIRQHTSAYVSIRQHTSAYVSIRQCLRRHRRRQVFRIAARLQAYRQRFS